MGRRRIKDLGKESKSGVGETGSELEKRKKRREMEETEKGEGVMLRGREGVRERENEVRHP